MFPWSWPQPWVSSASPPPRSRLPPPARPPRAAWEPRIASTFACALFLHLESEPEKDVHGAVHHEDGAGAHPGCDRLVVVEDDVVAVVDVENRDAERGRHRTEPVDD